MLGGRAPHSTRCPPAEPRPLRTDPRLLPRGRARPDLLAERLRSLTSLPRLPALLIDGLAAGAWCSAGGADSYGPRPTGRCLGPPPDLAAGSPPPAAPPLPSTCLAYAREGDSSLLVGVELLRRTSA